LGAVLPVVKLLICGTFGDLEVFEKLNSDVELDDCAVVDDFNDCADGMFVSAPVVDEFGGSLTIGFK
jgi:hypothetical protein